MLVLKGLWELLVVLFGIFLLFNLVFYPLIISWSHGGFFPTLLIYIIIALAVMKDLDRW